MKNQRWVLLTAAFLLGGMKASAQIGEHRNDFSVGANGGYVLSSVGFTPDIPQKQRGGITGGFSYRYVCEKYSQVGWKEKILDINNAPVIISQTGEAMAQPPRLKTSLQQRVKCVSATVTKVLNFANRFDSWKC